MDPEKQVISGITRVTKQLEALFTFIPTTDINMFDVIAINNMLGIIIQLFKYNEFMNEITGVYKNDGDVLNENFEILEKRANIYIVSDHTLELLYKNLEINLGPSIAQSCNNIIIQLHKLLADIHNYEEHLSKPIVFKTQTLNSIINSLGGKYGIKCIPIKNSKKRKLPLLNNFDQDIPLTLFSKNTEIPVNVDNIKKSTKKSNAKKIKEHSRLEFQEPDIVSSDSD